MKCQVYWLHYEEHTDVTIDGYVGVSTEFSNRLETHKKNKDNFVVRNAANSGYMLADIIFEGTVEECLNKERELRPDNFIGWNICRGGGKPPRITDIDKDGKIAKKISDTLKAKGANPYCENTHSKEARQKRIEIAKTQKRKVYHDPVTLKTITVNTGLGELPPDGWCAGRKPKPELSKRIRGVDYHGNASSWKVTFPDGKEEIVFALKSWCREHGFSYDELYANRNGWKTEKQKS
jgi:hypothetical protein